MDVLRSLTGLFQHEGGPVLEDYPHDAPAGGEADEAWSCPLPLPPLADAQTPSEQKEQALLSELYMLSPWYAEALRTRGRSTFGLSGLSAADAPEIAMFLARMAAGESPAIPAGVREPMPAALRSMADDLKAYYLEAASAQPGVNAPGPVRLNRWLYHETHLGAALYDIRDRLAAEAAAALPAGESPRPGPPTVALIPNRFRERRQGGSRPGQTP